MERHILATTMLSVGGGILIGAAAAWGEASRRSQLFFGERYSEDVASYDRAFQAAKAGGAFVEEPEIIHDVDGTMRTPEVVGVTLDEIGQDYVAAASKYSDVAATHMNVLKREFITDDEFAEDDGRSKEQVLVHMGDEGPLFVNEGVVMENWGDVLGPTILVDFYQQCPPGAEKVLYVRNNVLDTDYEVIQEIP